MTLSEIKQALAENGLRPLESLGQNFLFDQNISRQIVSWLDAPPGARVIEIGPGLGSLTQILLDLDIELTAIEIDKGLARWLQNSFQLFKNFRLLTGDAVELLPTAGPADAVIGNLPYNVSTPLLISLLDMDPLPRHCIFMLQKEVGQRLAAQPGTKEYGAVSILFQSYYALQSLKVLNGNVFYPAPDVDSLVLGFHLLPEAPAFPATERRAFYNLVRRGTSQRRKKLRNTLPVECDLRPEALSVLEWQDLYLQLKREDKL